MCLLSGVNKKGPGAWAKRWATSCPETEEDLSIRGRLVRVERMLEKMMDNGRPEAVGRFRCQLDSVTNLSCLPLHLETQTSITHLAPSLSILSARNLIHLFFHQPCQYRSLPNLSSNNTYSATFPVASSFQLLHIHRTVSDKRNLVTYTLHPGLWLKTRNEPQLAKCHFC